MTDTAIKRADLKPGEFSFKSRGMGSNWCPCLICGHLPKSKCQADTAFFVDPTLVIVMGGKENPLKDDKGKIIAHHPILDLFHDNDVLASLDYRDFEPHWLQLKLGACGEHAPNLELLSELTRHDGMIDQRRLLRVVPSRKRP